MYWGAMCSETLCIKPMVYLGKFNQYFMSVLVCVTLTCSYIFYEIMLANVRDHILVQHTSLLITVVGYLTVPHGCY